jgi:hypothetical protein
MLMLVSFLLDFLKKKDTSYRKKIQVVKRWTKKKTLGECEVTPSGRNGILSLTINEVYFISCPIAFGK